MAVIAVNTAGKIEVVASETQLTLVAAEAITAGFAVRLDTSSGKFTPANGSAAGEARIFGIALKSVAADEPVTAVRKGYLDGWDLSGMNYDAVVYLSDTDGRLDTAAGTVSTVVGRVIPGSATTLGTAMDKILFVDL